MQNQINKISGYQAGILFATGHYDGTRYVVQNVDKWYCDVVQPLFGTSVYSQIIHGRDKPQYVVKGSSITDADADILKVTDMQGFCRAYIELKSSLGVWRGRARNGGKTPPKPRLRIYGSAFTLELLMGFLPASPKKIQLCSGHTQDGYNGHTCAVYYQSASEIAEILDYIDGFPRNDAVWEKWMEICKNII